MSHACDIFCYKILSVHNFPKRPRQSLEIVLILYIWFDCSYLTYVCRYLMQNFAEFAPTMSAN